LIPLRLLSKKRKALGVKKIVLEGYEGRGHGFFNFGRSDGKDYYDTVKKMDAFLAELGWLKAKG